VVLVAGATDNPITCCPSHLVKFQTEFVVFGEPGVDSEYSTHDGLLVGVIVGVTEGVGGTPVGCAGGVTEGVGVIDDVGVGVGLGHNVLTVASTCVV